MTNQTVPTLMTPNSGISISAGIPIPQFLTSAAAAFVKNKRNSYQPFRSTELSTTLGAGSTTVIDSNTTPLLNMNEKLRKQKEAQAYLTAGMSRHFSPKRGSHQECKLISQLH